MSKLSQNMSNIKNIYYSIPFTYSSSSFCLSYRIAIVSIHPFIHSFIEFQFTISLLITITIPLSHSECNFPLMTNIFVIIWIIFWFKISSQLIVTPLKPLCADTDDIRDLFGYHNWEATWWKRCELQHNSSAEERYWKRDLCGHELLFEIEYDKCMA